MKKKIIIFSLACLMPVLIGLPVNAQDAGGSRLFAILENGVQPANSPAFEKSLKELNLLKDQNDIESWSGPVFQMISSSKYLHVFPPMESFGDLDVMQKELTGKIDKKWNAVLSELLAVKEYEKWWIVLERADLSYNPENNQPDFSESFYLNIIHIYIHSGKNEELEDLSKEWVKLYKEKKIATGFTTYETIMGDERPLFILAETAKSPAEYYKQVDEISTKLGDEGKELSERSIKVIRKVEKMGGMYRPDLSYFPN